MCIRDRSKIAEQKRAQAKLQASLKDQESKINSVVGELRLSLIHIYLIHINQHHRKDEKWLTISTH